MAATPLNATTSARKQSPTRPQDTYAAAQASDRAPPQNSDRRRASPVSNVTSSTTLPLPLPLLPLPPPPLLLLRFAFSCIKDDDDDDDDDDAAAAAEARSPRRGRAVGRTRRGPPAASRDRRGRRRGRRQCRRS